MVTSPSHAAMRGWTERPNDSLEDSANLPDPHILVQEIADARLLSITVSRLWVGGSGDGRCSGR